MTHLGHHHNKEVLLLDLEVADGRIVLQNLSWNVSLCRTLIPTRVDKLLKLGGERLGLLDLLLEAADLHRQHPARGVAALTHGLRLIGVNREELVGHRLERNLHRGWDEEVDVGDLM